MSKVIIVVQKWIESYPDAPLDMYVERCFLTEEAANKWILDQNPKHPDWFEYVCPAEGTRESHSYTIDYTVLEEE
jgi:hypothetical protein